MDSQVLVAEQIDAGADFVRRFQQAMPIKAAFWLRPADADEWLLYLAPDSFTGPDVDRAYQQLLRIAGEMRNPNLGPFDVRLTEPDAPMVRAVLDILRLYPGPMPIRYNNPVLGGIGIEGAYIYPAPIPAHSV